MKPPEHLCQSCHCLVEEDANFCSICGQKKILKTVSLRELVGDFFSNLFSLDTKFLRTFGLLIFLPGKLTKEYIIGRRKLYYTPIRLFLFWLTITFLLLNFVLSGLRKSNHEMDRTIQVELYKDSLSRELNLAFTDSIVLQKLDSLLLQNSVLKNAEKSFISFGENSASMKDLYLLDPDEIIKKNNIQGIWKQQFFHQMAKAVRAPGYFQLHLLSHLSWIILMSIPFAALILKLLYIRRKKLYIEHLVYLLHLHTFLFISCSCLFIFLLLNSINTNLLWPILCTLTISGIYFIASIKTVYQQSLFKTISKIILFLTAYALLITIILSIFMLINFFAF